MHEDERQTVARLENSYSNRRVSQARAPALDLHAARCKQPTLGLLEGQRGVLLYIAGHGSVPFASLLVDEMIPVMDGFGLAHRISRKQDRLLDRLRDQRAADAAGLPGTADTFTALVGSEFALLVTFRRTGEPVPTPVWFGLHDGCVYVESLADAGKVKRLRHDRRVRVAPCTVRGKPNGPFADGLGRILGPAQEETAELALDRHYGLSRRLYVRLGTRLRVRSVYLELTPAGIERA